MHDEPEVRLVEPHPQRARRHEGLELVALELLLELFALVGVGPAGVRPDRVAALAQQPGDVLGRGDGQRVDDPAAGQVAEVRQQPPQPCAGVRQGQDPEPERRTGQGPADREHRVGGSGGQLLGDVLDHALVRGGRRRQHGHAVGQGTDELGQTAVVRPEVVPPVGDAVRFVDDEHPHAADQCRQLFVAELRVVEPFGRDQQDVDLVARQCRLGVGPLVGVRGVDRDRSHAGPGSSGHLVAHERQQGRHEHRRPTPTTPEQQRRQEVHGGLAPPGALHHQRTLPVLDQRGDRLELPGVEDRVGPPRERSERLLRFGSDVCGRDGRTGAEHGGGHAPMLSAPTDEPGHEPPGCGEPGADRYW